MSRLLFSLLLIIVVCFACQPEEDANLSPANPDLAAQYEDLNQRLHKYSRNNDSAVYYGREMLRLAQQLDAPRYWLKAYIAKASALEQLEQYDSAIHYYELAKAQFVPGLDTTDLSLCYTGAGHCYFYNERYDEALENYQTSIKLHLNGSDLNALSGAYSNAGMVLMQNELYDEAITYYQKAIALSEKVGPSTGELPPLHNLSVSFMKQAVFDSAIYYAQMVKNKSQALAFPFGEGLATHVLAESYLGLDDASSADREAREGEKIFNQLKADRELNGMLLQRAASQHALGQQGEALRIVKDLLSRPGISEELQQRGWLLRSNIEKALGYYKAALESHTNYSKVLSDLNRKKAEQKIASLQFKFDSQLKDQQILNLETQASLDALAINQQQTRVYLLAAMLVLLLAGGYFYSTRQKERSKNRLMELENRLLRTQLNPHFLFNAMGAIQQYLYSQEDPQMISDYLGKFSKLTRMILNYSKKEFISLEEELTFLQYYVDLQKIRFEVPFEFQLEVDDNIDPDELLIPPMLTQPFIENAIEHGFLHKQEKGHIQMSIREKDQQILVTVEDDGIGRKQAAALRKQTRHQSHATQITKDRLKIIQKRLKQNTELLVKDLLDQNQQVTGTQVQLNLPLIRS